MNSTAFPGPTSGSTARPSISRLGPRGSRYPVTVIGDFSRELSAKIRDLLQRRRYDLLVCDFLQPSLTSPAQRIHDSTLQAQRRVRHCPSALETATIPPSSSSGWASGERCCASTGGLPALRRRCDCSELDKLTLEQDFGARNVFAIPTVSTRTSSAGNRATEDNTLIFTGAMDWLPNEMPSSSLRGGPTPPAGDHPSVSLTVVGRILRAVYWSEPGDIARCR